MPKYVVRYGTMRALGVMTARNDASYRRSMEVVVRSDRGLEIGQVLCEASEDALLHLDKPAVGSIVRQVSADDTRRINDIDAARSKKLEICQKHIDALGLDMKLVEVEQLLGGERVIIYYISEDRVDFRELVRLMASEFKTRIEMRQIGVRDEAKLLADYGDCGKPVCCNTHLSAMPPVSMKMAKLQKATLDPTKISGRCGRLKCCLRYEYDNYVEMQQQLPKVGTRVITRKGTVKVLNQQILAEQLLVETEDHRKMVIDASEVLSVIDINNSGRKPNNNRRQKNSQGSDADTDSEAQRSEVSALTEASAELDNVSESNSAETETPEEIDSGPKKPTGKRKSRRSNRNRHRKRGSKKGKSDS